MKSAFIIPVLAIFLGIGLLFGAVMMSHAGHHGHSMFSANIDAMDTNRDGKVSFDEYSAFHTEKLRWSFNALDTNNDASISADEWEMFLKMHGMGKSYDHNQQG